MLMDINVKVSVDLTERTVSALRGIFSGETSGARPQHSEDTRKEPQGGRQEEPQGGRQEEPQEAKEAHAGTAEPEAGDLSTEMPFDRETAPEEAKKPKQEAKQPEAKAEICSDETLRAHMDARFRALIGDDWENAVSSDPEAKKKQRQITNCFKQIAGKLGAVKPTLLPQDLRHKFVEEIKNITVGDDGEIQILPF